MSLRVYNTLSQQKELFQPLHPGKVGMYLCGPTVYKPSHIGHMVGPVIFDAVKRYLRFKGYEVTWVVNITDVDDKLIDRARAENTTVAALAEKYTQEYFENLKAMGVDTIDRFPKASEHIPEIVAMCQKLIDSNHAYAAQGNVWFDVATDTDYGKLSHRQVEQQESGTRDLEGGGKRNPADFALWKAARPDEIAWDSPWGSGRPGWHIECSAMSMKYLGETFDIHGGGMDLMFPHHENELAQSESASGQPFARFWMHNGLTRLNTKKISGSDAATPEGAAALAGVAVRRLLEQYSPELLRYLLLSTHYRRPIEFTDEVLAASRKGLAVFHRLFERIERIGGKPLGDDQPDMDKLAGGLLESPLGEFVKSVLQFKMKFLEMMDDDFNTAGAIAVLHELAGQINACIEKHSLDAGGPPEQVAGVCGAAQTLRGLGMLLGLLAKSPIAAQNNALADGLMQLFIRLREEARQSRNFALADGIRKGLTELGVMLEDGPQGTRWRAQ